MWARKQIYKLTSHKFRFENYLFSSDNTLLGKVHDMAKALRYADKAGFNTLRRCLANGNANRVKVVSRVDGKVRDMVMFGSNSYLGLNTHPRVMKAAQEAIVEYGTGSGGVPLLSGTNRLQDSLEKKLAELKDCEDAILFTSGYLANMGCISGLMRDGDLIINDRLNHASIIDGCRLCGSKCVSFKHNSTNGLQRKLDAASAYRGRTLVIMDGVFSMEGDIARLDAIVPLAKEYGALVMIDDAHATGVIGERGKGTKSHFKMTGGVDIVVGTLSKGIGAVGGFVASSKEIIDYLRIYSRSNMYSTALPPPACAAALESIRVMTQEPHHFENLWKNIDYVKSNLKGLGFRTGKSETAIIPVFVENDESIVMMQREIHDRGLFLNTITSPVVPPNESRFRVSVMATHTREDMDFMLNIMEDVGRKYKVI